MVWRVVALRRNYLYRITAPHFIAGLVVREIHGGDLVVIQTAPIVRYMSGWAALYVQTYCARKRWELEIFDDPQPTG